MKFSKGENVRAKWPGSSLYYEGVVVESGDDDALVRFEEGTQHRIGIKHIKNDNMFKSPGRPSNPNSTPPRMSTRRSPARSSKSPARTSKSPARTSKSPTRTSKSPARTSKSPGRISKKSSKEDITSSSSKSQTTKMELTPSTKKKSTRSPTRKANSVAEPVVSVKKVSVTSKPLGTTVSRTTVSETKKSVRSFETTDEPHVSATKDSKTYITGREQRPLLSEDFKLSFLGRQPHLLVPSREHTWRKPTIISTHEDSTEMTYKFSGNSGSSLSTEPPLKSAGSRERFSQQREDSPFVSIARRSIRGDSPFLVADRGSTRSDSPSISTAGRSVREDSPAVTLLRRETRGSVLRELNSHSTPIREITPLPTQIYSPKFKLYDYKPIVEFGGWFGALAFMFILPLSVLALHLHCNKTSCSFVDNKLNIPLNWQAYFDPMAAAIYLGFVAFLLLLYFLPVGEHIEAADSRAVSYRCNGFLTALVALAVVGGLHYQGYPVTVVYDKYIQLIVSSLVFGFLLAIILFIKGGRVPINATLGKNHIYLFWMGREVTPHFGPVAIKVLIFRIGVIGSVVLTSALVVKHFGPNPSQYSPTLVVSVAMQIIYLLDSLWFEKVWATSFEFKYEGVGAMLAAGYCVYPFLNTLVVKYIVEHRVELPPYYLAVLATVFIIGLVIFRLSNNLKDEFKTNPLSRKLEGVETISSFGGKKLLVSSWWGWLRHPNYLGDILIHWAWGLTCGWPIVLPYFLALATTMLLVHRAVRDDIRCKQRYGTGWDRYCSRVKYRIVPHVF